MPGHRYQRSHGFPEPRTPLSNQVRCSLATMQEPKQKRAIYLSTSASGERGNSGTGRHGAGAPISHLRPVGKATETPSDSGRCGEGWSTFPPCSAQCQAVRLHGWKINPCLVTLRAAARLLLAGGTSMGQGSRAARHSASTKLWGPAWLWGQHNCSTQLASSPS